MCQGSPTAGAAFESGFSRGRGSQTDPGGDRVVVALASLSCLYGRGVASPVLKIAGLGLPLQIVRNVLDDLRTFGRRDLAEGMSQGLTAYGGQHHGHVMQRYTGLLPALHEGRHLTVQSGYLWKASIVKRRIRD